MNTDNQPKFELLKYFPLVKIDEATHTAYGISTCEQPDKDDEICDYAGAKEQYQIWSREAFESTTGAGQEVSLGNIRYMHRLILAGKATKIKFDDNRKQIWVESTPVHPLSKEDPDIWPLLRDGFLRGYSQGGKYISRVCNDCRKDIQGHFCTHCDKKVLVRYVPSISEISWVDNPCLKEAAFTLVKADGSSEIRKFSSAPQLPTGNEGAIPTSPTPVNNLSDTNIGNSSSIHPNSSGCSCGCAACKGDNCPGCTSGAHGKAAKAVKHLVEKDGEKHLPYTDSNGKPNHRLMGAAWAALHSGFRGNKYEGPDKSGAIKRLKRVYAQEGLDTPSEKSVVIDAMLKNILEEVIQNRAYGQLGKGLYTVSNFSRILEDLKILCLSMEYEREIENDESPVTDDVREAYHSLLDHLLTYVEEQVAEEKEHASFVQ